MANRTQAAPAGKATFHAPGNDIKGMAFRTTGNAALQQTSSTQFTFDTTGNPVVLVGGVATQTWLASQTPNLRTRTTSATLAFASGTGVKGAVANPFGALAMVTRAVLLVYTKQGATSTFDIGVAADSTTASDNLIDGANMDTGTPSATAPVVYDSITGTDNGVAEALVVTATGAVTINVATGNGQTAVFTLILDWTLL